MNRHPTSDKALKEIASIWEVEDQQATWFEDGFDWVPGSHAVHVRVSQRTDDVTERERFRISVETEFLQSVPVEDTQFVERVGAMAQFFCSTYSLTYLPSELWKEFGDGKKPNMSMFSSAYVDEGTVTWLPRFLAHMAIMQPIDAETRSSAAPEMFRGGEPAFAHGSKKSVYDDVLNVAETIFAPAGKTPSNWAGSEEFEQFTEQYAKNDNCFGMGDPDGMTLETPFGDDTVLIRFHTDQTHPQLGNGLLITTQIRWPTTQNINIEAAFLNFWESKSWTDFPQLGCWHPKSYDEGQPDLSHSYFIPNALFGSGSGFVTNLALWALVRARWVRELRFPDLEDLKMIEILQRRHGVGSDWQKS